MSLTMKTHDYTRCAWGHNIEVLSFLGEGKRLRVAGWGLGIAKGDYLLLNNKGDSTRYQVSSIKYRRDPPDMWTAELMFAPRENSHS